MARSRAPATKNQQPSRRSLVSLTAAPEGWLAVWEPPLADGQEELPKLGRAVAMFGAFHNTDGSEVIHGLVLHPDHPMFVVADQLPGFAGYMRIVGGTPELGTSRLVLPR